MLELLKNLQAKSTLEFPCVLITVAHTVASAPRESGAKLLVTADNTIGTIGGGNLEFTAIQKARDYLSDSPPSTDTQFVELYALGPMLAQCCGGVVFLHYELVREAGDCPHIFDSPDKPRVMVRRSGSADAETGAQQQLLVTADSYTGSLGDMSDYVLDKARSLLEENSGASFTLLESLKKSTGVLPDISDVLLFDVMIPCNFHLAVYGAGHVGSAVVKIMSDHPACRLKWVDSRKELFPQNPGANVTMIAEPALDTINAMPAGSYFLVMTHDHGLDRDLCEAILRRQDFRFLGLIGSQTKLRRFSKHFKNRGFSDAQLASLTCPIGIDDIQSKEPMAIAVSVSAQLLQLEEIRRENESTSAPGQVPLRVTHNGRR